jgi:protein TonB
MMNHATHAPGWPSESHGRVPFRDKADKTKRSRSKAPAEDEDALHATIPRHRDQGLLLKAFVGAVVVHLLAMFITLPRVRKVSTAPKVHSVISVRRYVPPPPRIERPQVIRGAKAKKKAKRIIPMPDPTPDDLEPLREPQPELVFAGDPLAPDDVEFLIGEPEGPPSGGGYAGPGLAGVGGITLPKLIEKVRPEYPEMARKARLESRVFLKAVILADGSVGEIELVGCDCPCMGFEEAAIAAVEQWTYEPATLNGRPVDVYFTVVVDFTIA